MTHMHSELPDYSIFSDCIDEANRAIEQWQNTKRSLVELRFIAHIVRHSPYLTRLLQLYEADFDACCSGNVEAQVEQIIQELYAKQCVEFTKQKGHLYVRECKQRIALLIALADIGGIWGLARITSALSDFADAATQFALEQILRADVPKTIITDAPISAHLGIAILGMGKLGGRELNYSSDIDLIALYEDSKLDFLTPPARGRFAVRIIQQLAAYLQDRQQNGYVFRVDLRLRPDPASTGLAVGLHAAIRYYEHVGQNWERAAMIKARIIAGDRDTGAYFLSAIQPFLWRNHLDFAAIDDILSIKRQMQTKAQAHNNTDIILPLHNIKTGYGGIREIEFLAQIYQLIWGGRVRDLRIRATCHVLDMLQQQGFITPTANEDLQSAYYLFRLVEHRLQMRMDQQTHSLPESQELMEELSRFCGFDTLESFTHTMQVHLERVHHYFNACFADSTPLGSTGGKLVFTGVSHDEETLETLAYMGFSDTETISLSIQQWHKGSKRCTRSKKARELLTELVPALLEALSNTVDPDQAFKRFDDFLDALPAGIQLFSLFYSNPNLLTLVTKLIGNAPVLARRLSRYPQLIDLVVQRNFSITSAVSLEEDLTNWLNLARNEEEIYHYYCMFKLEKEFMVGVRLLERSITPKQASQMLTHLADTMINKAVQLAMQQLSEKYQITPNIKFCLIALGKLGSQSLIIGSDLDVMCIYDMSEEYPAHASISQQDYYNRLTARVINLLAYPTKDGALYDMDTQLRPYGNQGAVAVKLDAFSTYYESSSWVVENMALLQARIVHCTELLRPTIELALHKAHKIELPYSKIIANVHDVRKKIHAQHYSSNPWDIKYVWGGMMDIQWILKTLLAKSSTDGEFPEHIYRIHTQIAWLVSKGLLTSKHARTLRKANRLFHTTLSYLRLCHTNMVRDDDMTEGFKALLTEAANMRSFEQLRQRLLRYQSQIYHIIQNLEYS
jgi:[glutamine synthetase] adenylyltransferase / [glutamine synthetase]-adenylyl-L-tyrosine phosphorylase